MFPCKTYINFDVFFFFSIKGIMDTFFLRFLYSRLNRNWNLIYLILANFKILLLTSWKRDSCKSLIIIFPLNSLILAAVQTYDLGNFECFYYIYSRLF